MAENREGMEPEGVQEDADRGMPSINRRGKPAGGIGQKIILGAILIVVVLALIAVNGGFSSDDEPSSDREERRASSEIGNRLGPAPAAPPPPAPPREQEEPESERPNQVRTGQIAPPPAPSYPTTGNGSQQSDAPPSPEDRKRESGLLAFGNISSAQASERAMTAEERAYQMQGAQGQGGGMMGVGLDDADRADGLAANLQPTQLEGARAGLIADRNMFVTRGTFLDCALETAISSDVPGMTSCRLTRDVYSTSGRVLLLERGSRITGQYQSGIQRGQARIFVLWDRIETPNGVVVNLDSPGTDGLGRSGHEGHIDTHFWQRWGGAIMLSLVDDIGTYVANEASRSGAGGNQIQFGGTTNAVSNAASIALENSINIPPTLVKHQGDHINVFVARDLDFRGVYDLKTNN